MSPPPSPGPVRVLLDGPVLVVLEGFDEETFAAIPRAAVGAMAAFFSGADTAVEAEYRVVTGRVVSVRVSRGRPVSR